MENYSNESISALIGEQRVRKRPAAMLGSAGLDGARHGFKELYGNALDEASTGFGTRLDVHYYKDGSISIRDYGRGVPMGWNNNPEVQNWNWHAIYNELYGGGKYNNHQEKLAKQDWSKFDARDYNYLFSVGLNGLGAASTQYTSEFFVVKSYRDGVCTSRSYAKGRPLVNGEPVNMFVLTPEAIKAIPEEICETNEPNGTYIRWKPDIEVFDSIDVGGDWLLNECRYISTVAGIDLSFIDDNTGKNVELKKGTIVDLLQDELDDNIVKDAQDKPVIFTEHLLEHGMIRVENKPFIYVCEADIALAFTDKATPSLCFHNSVKMKDGVQYTAIEDAVMGFFKERTKGFGVKFDPRDVQDIFTVIVSTKSNYLSPRNQTKDGVDDFFVYDAIKKCVSGVLNKEFLKKNAVLMQIVAAIIEKAQERQAQADYERINKMNQKLTREKTPDKFISCEAYEKKRYEETELWITEGDSAATAVTAARNRVFQAVFPIRGKSLNVLKKSIDRIMKNTEIKAIFTLLGTGMDIAVKGKPNVFDYSRLKFNKIIFATDADEDGYQIRVLLFLIFYKLAPELIRKGHIYIAETPRFKINFSDGTYIYVKDDAERDKVIKEQGGRITKISRYKGLGEVNASDLRETTIAPATRNLIQLDCDFDNVTERDLIDALFGADKYGQRKELIATMLKCDIADIEDFDLELEDDDEEEEENED